MKSSQPPAPPRDLAEVDKGLPTHLPAVPQWSHACWLTMMKHDVLYIGDAWRVRCLPPVVSPIASCSPLATGVGHCQRHIAGPLAGVWLSRV